VQQATTITGCHNVHLGLVDGATLRARVESEFCRVVLLFVKFLRSVSDTGAWSDVRLCTFCPSSVRLDWHEGQLQRVAVISARTACTVPKADTIDTFFLEFRECENGQQKDVILKWWVTVTVLGLRLGSGSGSDSVFKLCSLYRERHWYYAHVWPWRLFIVISRSHPFAGLPPKWPILCRVGR